MAFASGNPTKESIDLTQEFDLSKVKINATSGGDNCFIRSVDEKSLYDSFILLKNTRTTILCYVTFYRSKTSNKYLPRLTFKKLNKDGTEKLEDVSKPVNINLSEGDVAIRFWKMINFLNNFKEIVDTGDFKNNYAVVSNDYAQFIKSLDSTERIKAIKMLISRGNFSSSDMKSIVFEYRKRTIKAFLWLLKNINIKKTGESIRDRYKEKYNLPDTSESIWHHFLKNNDWILGLCADYKFIREFQDEVKLGIESSTGKESPKADMLGYSNYTTLVELKTCDTKIFKTKPGNNSRANTWEFTPEFISGVCQCLGQKSALDESYSIKAFEKDDESYIPKELIYSKDVKSIFIIGSRYSEFPHNNSRENKIKSNTFELFRRNNRNIEIITYDELFERAYHIVFSEKIQMDWFTNPNFTIDKK